MAGQQISYAGHEEHRPQAEAFLTALHADPETMASALGIIAGDDLTPQRMREFTGDPPPADIPKSAPAVLSGREKRRLAFIGAMDFVSIGPDAGNFEYARPILNAISKDPRIAHLRRAHEITADNPARNNTVTLQIRAARLAIAATVLAKDKAKQAKAARATKTPVAA